MSWWVPTTFLYSFYLLAEPDPLEKAGLGTLPGFLGSLNGIMVHLTIGQCVFFLEAVVERLQLTKFLGGKMFEGSGWGRYKGRGAEKPLALGRGCLREPFWQYYWRVKSSSALSSPMWASSLDPFLTGRKDSHPTVCWRVVWEKFGARWKLLIIAISVPGDLSLWAWILLRVWAIKALGLEGDSTEVGFEN